jgi:sulfur carrier protein ThiS
MPAKIIFRDKEFDIRPGKTLQFVLVRLEIQPEAVLATKNGEMITEDIIIKDGDVIKLIPVISGGRR